jgi:uncharacterized repeat protein (TIGR02543 family)
LEHSTTASGVDPNLVAAPFQYAGADCWCRVTTYVDTDLTETPLSSYWFYTTISGESGLVYSDYTPAQNCSRVCPIACAEAAGSAILNNQNTASNILAQSVTSGSETMCAPTAYTITYNLNDGVFGENTIHPETYTVADANIAVANPTKAGYTFTGWTVTTAPESWGAGSTTTGGTSMVIATGTYGNIVLTANWIVACPENYFVPNDHPEMCFPHRLHVGENMVFMKSDKLTTPSLNVRVGNDVFYANMTTDPTYMSSEYAHYMKTIYNNQVYYICDDTTYGNSDYAGPDTNNNAP